MKPIYSQLELKDFSVIESSCKYMPHDDNWEKDFSSYDIDLDFRIIEEEDESRIIYVSIDINKDKIKSGYSISVESLGLFHFQDNTTDEIKSKLIISGISICITNLRGYIANMTSYSPLGRYTLPIIDMSELIRMKRIEFSQNEEK